MVIVSFLAATVLGACVYGVVYTSTENSRAGCYATHAVIRNLDNYFWLQIQHIESRTGYYANHPKARTKALKGYHGIIQALSNVRCS